MSRKLTKQMPTQAEILYMFDVNFDTGAMYWKNPNKGAHSVKIGDRAGAIDKKGYWKVWINNNIEYLQHRLIYVAYHGDDSLTVDQLVDHIDCNPSNNAIINLQAVSHRINTGARKMIRLNGKVPYCRKTKNDTWIVHLYTPSRGDSHCYGTYKTIEEAYLKARSKYLEFHGEYPPMDDEVLKQLNLESIVGK